STRFATSSQRKDFLRREADAVYAELTGGFREAVRVEELVFRAAERYPGLVPSRDEIAAERELPQARKRGAEIDQGMFLSHVLASPRAGRHLVHSMLRPKARSRRLRAECGRAGRVALGVGHVERGEGTGVVELRTPRFRNAEDDAAPAALESGVDLVLLDRGVGVGGMRGGVGDPPRHAGR